MNPDRDDSQQGDSLTKGIAVGAGGIVVGGATIAFIMAPQFRTYILIFFLAAIVLVMLAVAFLLVRRSRLRKKRAEGIEKDVADEFDKRAAASNDLNVKARLEDLKRKFKRLTDQLHEDGQDIYELPWFLTLGPSGTGKSWVLKGAGLAPLGEDEWKGGTFLIDWWTCNEALVLDTAGGVVFGEDRGYDSEEWTSLLELLTKNRPQCPINGVLVVVPAQLLWLKDDELPDKWLNLEEYAYALRIQIRERLQKFLGIRFPVYILVTQSDRIPGFREFADALDAAGKPKGQMLGWSNPSKIGAKSGRTLSRIGRPGSDPEFEEIKAVGRHFEQVAADLRRERLAMFTNYAGEAARADAAGANVRERAIELLNFPDAIQNTLAPRLQELLLTVFKPDPTQKTKPPPYLRGIYFTSALREGEVLDRQHARGVGKSLRDLALPGGADRKQSNPFFLKDLIFEKAFLESWLVTPLVETARYLSRRRRVLIWSGIGAGSLLLLAICIGGFTFNRAVGTELKQWNAVTNEVRNRYWLPVIEPEGGGFRLVTSSIEAHASLASAANAGFKGSSFWKLRWLFPSGNLDKPRREAQTRLFERGVILPLAEHARARFTNSTDALSQPNRDQIPGEISRFEGALLALLELELCPKKQTWNTKDLTDSRDRVLDGLSNYLLTDPGIAKKLSDTLKPVFDDTYLSKERQPNWPILSAKHAESLPGLVHSAFQRLGFMQHAQSGLFGSERNQLETLVTAVGAVRGSEEDFVAAVQNRDAKGSLDRLEELRSVWNKLLPGLPQRLQTFQQEFTNFAAKVENSAKGGQERLRQQIKGVNGSSRDGTNLIPLLDQEFQKLASQTPQAIERLTDFGPWNQKAAKLDKEMIAPVKEPGRENQTGGVALRLMDWRIGLYGQVVESSLSPLQRRLEDDLFQDPGGTIEKISGRAREAWSKFATNAVTGFMFEDKAYTEIFSGYVEYRYFEEFLKRATNTTAQALNSPEYNVTFSDRGQPKKSLQELGTVLDKLKNLEKVLNQLQSKRKDLGVRDGRSPVNEAKNWVVGTNDLLLQRPVDQIQKERGSLKKFPFEKAAAEVHDESAVIDSLKRAKAWEEAINDPKMASVFPKDNLENWEKEISSWLDRFRRLVDKEGEILEYEIRTPWGADVPFETLVGAETFKAARDANAVYRYWKFGSGTLHADGKTDSARRNAADGFRIEVNEHEDKLGTAKLVTPLRSDRWTMIDLLNRADSHSKTGLYLVPIEVTGDKGPATVWFVIRPVQSVRK